MLNEFKDQYPVFCVEDVIVNYCSEYLIKSQPQETIPLDSDFIFVPNHGNLEKRNISAANVLYRSRQDNIFPVHIHSHNNSLRIYKGTHLGWIEKVDVENQKEKCLESDQYVLQLGLMSDSDYFKQFKIENDCSDIKTLLIEFRDIFSSRKMDLGKAEVEHRISTGNSAPIALKYRRVPLGYENKVEAMIQEMLENGLIRESNSPWNFPVVLVKKKNGDIRLCIDYRKLNEVTQRPIFPLPDSKELFDCLQGAKFFSSLDLSQGYHQIPMHDNDKCKTAFTTRTGQYEYNVMPFGLSGAPATFQRLMHSVLKGDLWEKCVVYLDDVLVFGSTLSEHNERLASIFKKFRDANLKLSPSKCNFAMTKLKYLGHIISEEGIGTDAEKVKLIQEWPIPKCSKEVHSFVGLCNYYRKFIPHFSNLIQPLQKLITTKDFKWTKDHEECFELLKMKLSHTPILVTPIPNCTYILDTDACHSGIGAVLSQIQSGEERVICYASNTLTKCQRKYCITRKELLAAFHYIKQFKYYLAGRKFILRTDHKALEWLLNWKQPNTSQYCLWKAELEGFEFTIQHRKGENHNNADVLSRYGKCEQCELLHNDPKKRRYVKVYQNSPELEVQSVEVDRVLTLYENNKDFFKLQREDSCLSLIIDLMLGGKCQLKSPKQLNKLGKSAEILWKNREKLRLRGDLLYFKCGEKYLLLVPDSMKETILRSYHNKMSHVGISKCTNIILERYYWIGVHSDVRNFIGSCSVCAKYKYKQGKINQQPLPIISSDLFEILCIDIAGPFRKTRKNNVYVCGMIDHFSKYIVLVPCKDISSKTIANIVWKNWISKFGLPKVLLSDNGGCFDGEFFREFCCKCGIIQKFSPPYHQQSNGLIERYFRTSKELLACSIAENGLEWDDSLPSIELSLRATKQETTKYSPFQILYGRNMRLPNDMSQWDRSRQSMNDLDKARNNFRSQTKHNILEMNKRQEKYQRKYKTILISIGDTVFIKTYNKGIHQPKFEGPFTVIGVQGAIYTLKGEGGCFKRHYNDLKLHQRRKWCSKHSNQEKSWKPLDTEPHRRYPSRTRPNLSIYRNK